jgi:hypothetical protein
MTVALLSLATPAAADSTSTYRLENGDVVSTSCYHGAYGWQCRSWTNGSGNNPQVVHVPADYTPNTNPAWGRGCRSCDGAAK